MNRPERGIDTKPLAANSKGVALVVNRNHAMVDAPSDADSSAPQSKLILP